MAWTCQCGYENQIGSAPCFRCGTQPPQVPAPVKSVVPVAPEELLPNPVEGETAAPATVPGTDMAMPPAPTWGPSQQPLNANAIPAWNPNAPQTSNNKAVLIVIGCGVAVFFFLIASIFAGNLLGTKQDSKKTQNASHDTIDPLNGLTTTTDGSSSGNGSKPGSSQAPGSSKASNVAKAGDLSATVPCVPVSSQQSFDAVDADVSSCRSAGVTYAVEALDIRQNFTAQQLSEGTFFDAMMHGLTSTLIASNGGTATVVDKELQKVDGVDALHVDIKIDGGQSNGSATFIFVPKGTVINMAIINGPGTPVAGSDAFMSSLRVTGGASGGPADPGDLT